MLGEVLLRQVVLACRESYSRSGHSGRQGEGALEADLARGARRGLAWYGLPLLERGISPPYLPASPFQVESLMTRTYRGKSKCQRLIQRVMPATIEAELP